MRSSGRNLDLAFRRRRGWLIFFRRRRRVFRLGRRRLFYFGDVSSCARFAAGIQPDDLLRTGDFRSNRPSQKRDQSHGVDERDQCDVSPETCVQSHPYFDSAFVAIPTFAICARCNESISVTSFCTGNSRSGRITMATSGFALFKSSRRAASESASTISLFILMVSSRSIEIVCTCALLMGALAALLEGMMRFMLFSSNGVVIIKIMSSTNARSSRGVTLISLKVEKLLRLEYRFISLLRHPERSRRIPLNSPLSFRAGIPRLRFASTGMTSSRELANAHVVLDVFMLELRCQFGGKVIHLHDHSANARNQEIVTEHRRNSDAECSHGSNERT